MTRATLFSVQNLRSPNLPIATLVIAGLYSSALFIAGMLPPVLASLNILDPASELYAFLSQTCNQNPLRSFWVFGYPLGLCGRCLGAYLGAAISSFWLARRLHLHPFKTPPGLLWAIAAVCVGITDKIVGYGALYLNYPDLYSIMVQSSSGWVVIRTLLGMSLGLGIALGLLQVMRFITQKPTALFSTKAP